MWFTFTYELHSHYRCALAHFLSFAVFPSVRRGRTPLQKAALRARSATERTQLPNPPLGRSDSAVAPDGCAVRLRALASTRPGFVRTDARKRMTGLPHADTLPSKLCREERVMPLVALQYCRVVTPRVRFPPARK